MPIEKGLVLMRSALGFLVIAGLVALPVASAAAQTQRRNAGLPKISSIEALQGAGGTSFGWINNLRVSTQFTYGDARRKGSPTIYKDRSYMPNLNVSFGIGTMGFAALSANYTRYQSESNIAAFALPIKSGSDSFGFDAVLGISPLPFLRAGLIGGVGKGNSSYSFTTIPVPAIGADSDTRRFGGFIGASYLVGRVSLSADAAVLVIRNKMRFDPGNIPPSSSWGSDVGMFSLSAAYAVTDKLQVSGGIVFNTIFSQSVAGNEPKFDTFWLTLQLGTKYRINRNWELTASALTWVANNRYDYTSATIGATYRF